MTNSKYSISAANRITGKSRTTISKHIAAGKLSFEKGPDGGKVIDASELIRVYGDACDFEREKDEDDKSNNPISKKPSPEGDAGEARTLKNRLEREQAERERERQNLLDQIDFLKESLVKSQDGHNRATLLLENHSKRGGDWEHALKAVEKKIADEQAKARQELLDFKKSAKEQISRYKEALEDERQKSFWQRIWN